MVLAIHLFPDNGTVRVMGLCPAFADTALVRDGLDARDKGLEMAVAIQGGIMTCKMR